MGLGGKPWMSGSRFFLAGMVRSFEGEEEMRVKDMR